VVVNNLFDKQTKCFQAVNQKDYTLCQQNISTFRAIPKKIY